MSSKKIDDPVLDEVREVRRRISAMFDHDPGRLVAYYMEVQRRYENRLLANDGVLKPSDNPAA